MNCQECLDELSTMSLREIPADSPIMQHCVTCADCARLTTRLRDREYDAANVLNNFPPLSSPLSVAETATALSKRRRAGHYVVMLSGIAGGIIIWIVAATMIIPAMSRTGIVAGPSMSVLRTETIALRCLSPQQAADIINPYVRSHGSTYYMPTSGISAITVRGTADELARSRDLIRDFERDPAAACHNSLGDVAGQLDRELQGISVDVNPEIAGTPAPVTAPTAAPKRK